MIYPHSNIYVQRDACNYQFQDETSKVARIVYFYINFVCNSIHACGMHNTYNIHIIKFYSPITHVFHLVLYTYTFLFEKFSQKLSWMYR